MLSLLKDNKFIYKTYTENRTICGIDQVISDNGIFTYTDNHFVDIRSTSVNINTTSAISTVYMIESLPYPTVLNITGTNQSVKIRSEQLGIFYDSAPMFNENNLIVIVPPNLQEEIQIKNIQEKMDINVTIMRGSI